MLKQKVIEKNFKSLDERLKKSKSTQRQEDHELTPSFSISKRSLQRNMIISTALLLTTLSSVQASKDGANRTPSNSLGKLNTTNSSPNISTDNLQENPLNNSADSARKKTPKNTTESEKLDLSGSNGNKKLILELLTKNS